MVEVRYQGGAECCFAGAGGPGYQDPELGHCVGGGGWVRARWGVSNVEVEIGRELQLLGVGSGRRSLNLGGAG